MASADDLPLALAQINPIVGGLDTNRHLIEDAIEQARAAGARAVVFPELALTGYPPEDLLLRPAFLRAVEQSLTAITRSVAGIDVILGAPVTTEQGLVNAALCLRDGREIARYAKQVLPNYSVFDEQPISSRVIRPAWSSWRVGGSA